MSPVDVVDELIFMTDVDVDLFDHHYARSEHDSFAYMREAWVAGSEALIRASSSKH